jgi:ATP-dependent DNA ligase
VPLLTPTSAARLHEPSVGTVGRTLGQRFEDETAKLIGPSRWNDHIKAAILYAFDLIELDGKDLRDRPFLDRKVALARPLGGLNAGILINKHVAEDGPTVRPFNADLVVSKRMDGTYQSGPCRVWIKVRNPASIAVQRERS